MSEVGRAKGADNSDDGIGSVDARIVESEEVEDLHVESQSNQDGIVQDVVGSSTVPQPDPPARSPTERLREKMAWDAGIAPPLPSTMIRSRKYKRD